MQNGLTKTSRLGFILLSSNNRFHFWLLYFERFSLNKKLFRWKVLNDIKTRKTFPEILFFAAKVTLFVFASQSPATSDTKNWPKVTKSISLILCSEKVEIYEEWQIWLSRSLKMTEGALGTWAKQQLTKQQIQRCFQNEIFEWDKVRHDEKSNRFVHFANPIEQNVPHEWCVPLKINFLH